VRLWAKVLLFCVKFMTCAAVDKEGACVFKIAVCDDDANELDRAAALLGDYLESRPQLSASLSRFKDGWSLVDALERGGDFDLYLLDVLMPGLNGIDVGKSIRRLGRDGAIIYLTTSPDYAVDSYLTQAFFYLLKPVGREPLFEVLDRAMAALRKRKSKVVIVNTHCGLRSIPLDDILYVERVDRFMRYYLVSGETVDSRTIRGSLREASAALLSDGRFAPCGASFVLGLHHVRSVEKNRVLMDSGGWVPVPQSAFADLKRAWMNYWLGGETKQ